MPVVRGHPGRARARRGRAALQVHGGQAGRPQERRSGTGWLAYEERSFEVFRSYYEYLPKGRVSVQYTVRLNNAGRLNLPPTRVEALYAPEMFGEAPNAALTVHPGGETPAPAAKN